MLLLWYVLFTAPYIISDVLLVDDIDAAGLEHSKFNGAKSKWPRWTSLCSCCKQ